MPGQLSIRQFTIVTQESQDSEMQEAGSTEEYPEKFTDEYFRVKYNKTAKELPIEELIGTDLSYREVQHVEATKE